MSFENQIQQWIQIDNQLRQLSEKIKELRNNKNSIEANINNYVESNNLNNTIIKITDGKIKFTKNKVQEALTFKYLEKSLKEIIKNDSQLNLIIEHLKQNRNTKIISEIKRFSNN